MLDQFTCDVLAFIKEVIKTILFQSQNIVFNTPGSFNEFFQTRNSKNSDLNLIYLRK